MIAEPYNRLSRVALVAWARNAKVSAVFPRVDLPNGDSSATRSAAWAAYDSVRRLWRGEGSALSAAFAKAYPGDTVYRHSLAEETEALRAAYLAAGDDPATINLKRLDAAGLLESYVLFARTDAGIAREYHTYSRAHRDQLRRFWTDFVIGAPYAK